MSGGDDLIIPCLCRGSMKFVHYDCLTKWIVRGDKRKCEVCQFKYKIQESRRPIYLWGFSGISKHDVKKCASGMVMLVVALLCMIGSIAFLFLKTPTAVEQAEEETTVEDAFLGKIAIIVFTVIGTCFFLFLQCNWYRKFIHKLARVNREIKLEVSEKDKCLLRNFALVNSLSTIRMYWISHVVPCGESAS